MRKKVLFLFFSFVLISNQLTLAEEAPPNNQRGMASEPFFSPSVGQQFYEVAYELTNLKDADAEQVEQSIIFLKATTTLNVKIRHILPDVIRSVIKDTTGSYSELVQSLLGMYLEESADLEVIRGAVRYLLNDLQSREEREGALNGLLNNFGGKNRWFDSELYTLLGILQAEKADMEAATYLFMMAYNSNKYNKLAFTKLRELASEQVGPAHYIAQLREGLVENPLDIEAAIAFAREAKKQRLYGISAQSYAFCADLYNYLYPSKTLPAEIYLPWSISNYNAGRKEYKCLQIAERLRKKGHFDLRLEAIAIRAAGKSGNSELAGRLLDSTQNKARQLYVSLGSSSAEAVHIAEQLGWFYSFVKVDKEQALDWANKAYSSDPNSPVRAAILAYSLVMNEQTDWAQQIINEYPETQISSLAQAQIQFEQGQEKAAIETLKKAIELEPGSLEAEQARAILAENNTEYISADSPDVVLTRLRSIFGGQVAPEFFRPDKIISVRFNLRGSKFSYGSDFGGSLAIINNSTEPLIISDDGLFTGRIRIDAAVSGDITEQIDNLISTKVQSAMPVKPGQSFIFPLHLITGRLKEILFIYPQASLDIELTAYLDPVEGAGGVSNGLRDIEPVKVRVKRPGVEVTGKYLRNRVNSLTKGKQGQRIKTSQLFVGLLAEQTAMANRQPLYRFVYADWMPAMIKSSLLYSLGHEDWVTRVHTMVAMLSLPLDYELIEAVSENLGNSYWPVRLMAVYLLSKNQDENFTRVLDWHARYDSSDVVRDMAIALGGSGEAMGEKRGTEAIPADQNK